MAGAMKINGGTTAILLGVVLTSTLGWGSYITTKLAEQATQIAVLDERLQYIEGQLATLTRRLAPNRAQR